MRHCSETALRSGSIGRLASLIGCIVAMLALSPWSTRAQQFDYDPDGYWKMPSPPATKGEFNGEDPIGLASRQHIPTDCSINWKDQTGKIYCFATAMSSQVFQDEPMTILAKAAAFWAKEHPPKEHSSKENPSKGNPLKSGASKPPQSDATPLAAQPAPQTR